MSRFRFSTFLSKFNLWVCIFNLLFSFLEFCNRLLVRLYASPIYTSWRIIDATWGVLWLASLSSVHGCFCYVWGTLLDVSNGSSTWFALNLLPMTMPFSSWSNNTTWSNYLFKLVVTILFSIFPHPNSNLNELPH